MLPSWKLPRYPPIEGIKKTHFNRIDKSSSVRAIEKEIYNRGSNICRGDIHKDYIKKSLQTYTGGIVYKEPDGEIVAFSLWTKGTIKKGVLAMKLMVLCAKETQLRLGSHMLHDLEIECLNENMEEIILRPVSNHVVPFYKKSNYKNNTKKGFMKKNIPKFTMKRSKNITKTRKIRTARPQKNHVNTGLVTSNLEIDES